jgi:hypothetical protein
VLLGKVQVGHSVSRTRVADNLTSSHTGSRTDALCVALHVGVEVSVTPASKMESITSESATTARPEAQPARADNSIDHSQDRRAHGNPKVDRVVGLPVTQRVGPAVGRADQLTLMTERIVMPARHIAHLVAALGVLIVPAKVEDRHLRPRIGSVVGAYRRG